MAGHPLLCVWFGTAPYFPGSGWSLGVVLTVAWVVVTFVRGFSDPLLALKEFGGVVLVKVGQRRRSAACLGTC
jgi:hypothetical protein